MSLLFAFAAVLFILAFLQAVPVLFLADGHEKPLLEWHKGGGAPKQKNVKMPKPQKIPPVPKPAPPPTESASDIAAAKMDMAAAEKRKKGLQKTILAGEDSDYTTDASGEQKKTLLG